MVHLIAPDDFDPDDALDTQWLRDHDGAQAMEMPHPEQEAWECLMAGGQWLYVGLADDFFYTGLDFIKRRYNDEVPW